MASRMTAEKVLEFVLSEEEDDENYFDGSDEDFGLVEEEIGVEMSDDKMSEKDDEEEIQSNNSVDSTRGYGIMADDGYDGDEEENELGIMVDNEMDTNEEHSESDYSDDEDKKY